MIRVFDGHCDTAYELVRTSQCLKSNSCHISLEKTKDFEAYAQIFAFCSLAGYANALSERDLFEIPFRKLQREVMENSEKVVFASSRGEIETAVQQGKTAILLSIEGAEVIDCNPDELAESKENGVVMSTVTWNAANKLAGSHITGEGLSPLGECYVKQAQSLGILIDVSHLSEKAFWDIMSITQGPIVASHSNCRALCNHSRNLTDDQLKAIAHTGGTVGLNLYPPFLGEHADFDTLRRHLDHMIELCGEDHVALGGDLDGCEVLAEGFTDLSSYVSLFEFLLRNGYSQKILDKIFWENLISLI